MKSPILTILMANTVDGMLDVLGRAIGYLPLAFVIWFVLLHQGAGYEGYLAAMSGESTSEARISYWSDLLALTLSPSGVTKIVATAFILGSVNSVIGLIRHELVGLSSAAKERGRANVVRGTVLPVVKAGERV